MSGVATISDIASLLPERLGAVRTVGLGSRGGAMMVVVPRRLSSGFLAPGACSSLLLPPVAGGSALVNGTIAAALGTFGLPWVSF